MSTATEKVANVDTESTDVGSSLAADPEDTHITVFVVLDQLALIDGSDSQFLLDSRDQGRALEASTFQRVDCLLKLLDLVETLMELDYSNVFFTSGLLSLDESGGVVDADNEATSNLRVKSTGVASLVNLQDFLDPSDDLVGRGVGRLVKVDHTVLLEHVNGAGRGRVAAGKGREVRRFHVKQVEVLSGKHIKYNNYERV